MMEPGSTIERQTMEALGLIGSASSTDGSPLSAGQEVLLTGRVLRVHASGFCVVEVVGAKLQPAVVVHAGNLQGL